MRHRCRTESTTANMKTIIYLSLFLVNVCTASLASLLKGSDASGSLEKILRDSGLSKAQLAQNIKNILLPGPVIPYAENLIQKPDFCNKLDCPKFKVVKDVKDEYQIRQYEPSKWVMTAMLGVNYDDAKEEMFMKLFEYIQGNNVKGEKIAMTAPVLMRLIPGQGPACDNNFTMAFYISDSITDPPKANDTSVYLQDYPKFTAFVRSFPGYVTKENEFIKETQTLIKYLNGTSFDKSFFVTAGYNSPFQLLDRHNEVWLFP